MDTMYVFLQHYWWFLVSLLASLLVFLLFVQGGQTFYRTLARTEAERTMLVNATGRKWEFTFTTLVTFGGAFFASFPLFYSTSFGGAYWAWVAILFCFVIQAVAYEFRSKPSNVLGTRTFDGFLFVNGLLGTFLLGVVVSTLFTGSDFTVNRLALTDIQHPIISRWGNGWHGLEALLDYRNLLLGLAVCLLARVLGLLYFLNAVRSETVERRARRHLLWNALLFVVLFVSYLLVILLGKGFAVDAQTGTVSLQQYKYLINLIEMPVVLAFLLVGIVAVLWGIAISLLRASRRGIWFSGIGTVLTVLMLFLTLGYNGTAYYPSATDPQSSLTIFNSSSSRFTLSVMSIVSLMIPFVLAYIWHAWRSMDRVKLTESEFSPEQKGAEDAY